MSFLITEFTQRKMNKLRYYEENVQKLIPPQPFALLTNFKRGFVSGVMYF